MKAVVLDSFGAADVMRLGEAAVPAPKDHEVLIEVAATSINRPDIVQREGHYPAPAGESEILGLECSGRVVAAGPKVTAHAIGDRVFALVGGGAYAEFVVAHAEHCLPIPDGFSFVQAACLAETYITAYLNLFRLAKLADGESVLLHGGGGGVGTAAISLVKALRPNSPIVVTTSAAKVERVRMLGVDRAIDYREHDFAEETKRFTERQGIDVILDHIGGAYFAQNLAALAINGRLVIIGIMQGSDANLSLGRLMIKRQSIIGSVLRLRAASEKAAIIADFSRTVVPLFARGIVEPVIDSVWPIENVVEAHRRMEESNHFGKIVLTVNEI